MKRFNGYVLGLVIAVLITAVVFEAPQAVNAQGKGGGAGVKGVLCEHIQSVAGNPTAEAIALCGDLLFKTVFATSSRHSGDLKTAGGGATGLEGADNICNLRAQAAGLPGTYTAWLSDSSTDAKKRVLQSVIPYVKVGGELVADDFADLLECGNPLCLKTPINRNQTGAAVGIPFIDVWTGTGTNGIGLGNVCADWTDGTNASLGRFGRTNFITGLWTSAANGNCVVSLRLFCFQD